MEVSSFDQDLLDRSEFAKRLEKFIEVEHQFVAGGLVLALSSKFGSGKSSFLKMWKHSLEENCEEGKTPMVIHYSRLSRL